MRSLPFALAVTCLLCACGSDEGETQQQPPPDGGPVDTGPFDIPWLADGNPPIQPSPAHTCPEGFTQETTDTGVISCRAWPAGGPAQCGGREAHFPGEPGCAAIGTACPAGEWPENLPSSRTVRYVRAGAPSGGDGSKASPYNSVGYAVSVAPPGSIVAVGKGTHDGRVDLFSGVTVWGACPEETILTQSVAQSMDSVVGAFLGDGELRNVTVKAPVTMGIFIDNGTQVRLQDVVVDGASGYALYFTGIDTHVDVENVIVRDAGPFANGTAGVGMQVIDGATATVKRTSIERSAQTQLVVAFGSVATFDRIAVRDATGEGNDLRAGLGMTSQEEGTATVTASGFWGNVSGGFLAALGSKLTLTDVAIEQGGTPGATTAAAALESRVDSTVEASFVLVEGAQGAAILAAENGVLLASDLVVRNTIVSNDKLQAGMAMSLEGEAQATLSRVLIEKQLRGGIVTMPGTRLYANDIVIRDIDPSGPRDLGLCMTLFGAETIVERARMERCTLEGIAASSGAVATLRDVVVRDVRSATTGGIYGRGLEVNLGAQLIGDRVLLERNRDVGLMAVDPGSLGHFTNFVIRDTMAQACDPSCIQGAPFGYGISAKDGGHVELEGFLVTRSFVLGLQVGPGSSIVGSRGEISENVIGINVQEETFDAGSALVDVEFRDNQNNYDGAAVPLPQVLGDP